ncbi:MAG TPA: hypothetical protein VK586_11730 [Streptosporangiaceae bacterium]|nr:hypothetical protein [Streptosporangiaceae bacterium]
MRYQTAVGKLRTLAGACEAWKRWPPDHPLLQAAYAFGDLHVLQRRSSSC